MKSEHKLTLKDMGKKKFKLSSASVEDLQKVFEDDKSSDSEVSSEEEEEPQEEPLKKEDANYEPVERMQEDEDFGSASSSDESPRNQSTKGRAKTPSSRKSTPKKAATPKKVAPKKDTPHKEKSETPSKRGRKRKAEEDPEDEKVNIHASFSVLISLGAQGLSWR